MDFLFDIITALGVIAGLIIIGLPTLLFVTWALKRIRRGQR